MGRKREEGGTYEDEGEGLGEEEIVRPQQEILQGGLYASAECSLACRVFYDTTITSSISYVSQS